MEKNLFRKVKEQIDKQTRDKLFTKIYEATPVHFVEPPGGEEPVIEKPIPVWQKRYYNYDRGSAFLLNESQFNSYEGNIQSSNLQDGEGGFSDSGLSSYANVCYQVKVLAEETSNFLLYFQCRAGCISVYTKVEDGDDVCVFSAEPSIVSGSFGITLPSNQWVTISIYYYCYLDDGHFLLYGGLRNYIDATSSIEVSPPSTPVYSNAPLISEILDPKINSSKVTLYWKRNPEISFKGNGIYKKVLQNSSVAITEKVPTYYENNAFIALGNCYATLLVNASIQLNATGTFYTIGKLTAYEPNLIKNPVFRYDLTEWTTSGNISTISKDYEVYKACRLDITGSSQTNKITTSSYSNISTANNYVVNCYYRYNEVFNPFFEKGNIDATPSLWNKYAPQGGSATLLATPTTYYRTVKVKKETATGTVWLTSSTINLKNGQHVIVRCLGSTNSGVQFGIRRDNPTAWATFKTISANNYWTFDWVTATVNTTASYYAFFGFNGNYGSAGSIGYCHQLETLLDSTGVDKTLKVYFYDSGSVLCSPASAEKFLGSYSMSGNWIFDVINLSKSSSLGSFYRFPSDCAKVKTELRFNSNASTDIYAKLLVDGFYLCLDSSNRGYNPTTQAISIVSVTPTLGAVDGKTVYQKDFTHIVDKNAPLGASTILSYVDTNVISGQNYAYVIDAYDLSGNRSGYSVIASITATLVQSIPEQLSGYVSSAYKIENITCGVPTTYSSFGVEKFKTPPEIVLFPSRVLTYKPADGSSFGSLNYQFLELIAENVGTTDFTPKALLYSGNLSPTSNVVTYGSPSLVKEYAIYNSTVSTIFNTSYDALCSCVDYQADRISVKLKPRLSGLTLSESSGTVKLYFKIFIGEYSAPTLTSVIASQSSMFYFPFYDTSIPATISKQKEFIFSNLSKSNNYVVKLDFYGLATTNCEPTTATIYMYPVKYEIFGTVYEQTEAIVGAYIFDTN